MKNKKVPLALLVLLLMGLACNFPALTPSAPEVTVTPYVPSGEDTPIPSEPTEPPTTEEPEPTTTGEPELTASPSPTGEPSSTPGAPPPRPTSAGPLDFEAPNNPTGWQELPDGYVEVSIIIHIQGGAPPFQIQDTLFEPGTVFETYERDYTISFRWWGSGGVAHTITIESADGQRVSRDHWVFPTWSAPTPTP